MRYRVPLFDLYIKEKEVKKIVKVLKRGWLTFGEECIKFEEEFKRILGSKYSLFVSSATAGLHLVYKVLFNKDDEVLVPSFTFISTVTPLLHIGAHPVFVDIESIDFPLLSIKDAEKKITKKTRGLVYMHYAGYLRNMKEVVEFCKENNLILIEDSAHSLFVKNEKYAGTFGKAGVFSFFSNKNLPIGEGGMVVTDYKKIYEKLKLLRSHGMTKDTIERFKKGFLYDVVEIGFNYRPTEIQGALAREILKRVFKDNRKRERIVKKYRKELSKFLRIPFDEKTPSSHYIFPVFCKDKKERDELKEFLFKNKIQTSIHYIPVHKFKVFREIKPKIDLPVTEEAGDRELTLPLYPSMKKEDVDYVIEKVKKFFT
ncbi:MAG: DegT/DnrJ/EryC1/StrS family aminotransferase [candidate division WOR-3 bacterium]